MEGIRRIGDANLSEIPPICETCSGYLFPCPTGVVLDGVQRFGQPGCVYLGGSVSLLL